MHNFRKAFQQGAIDNGTPTHQIKIIYRKPYGNCRSMGVFIITPPYDSAMPATTSHSWEHNHFLLWVKHI